MSQRVGFSSTFSNSPELSTIRATAVPSNKPKVVAEKARNENPLIISSMAIINQPKPKPIAIPMSPAYCKFW